VVADEDCEGVVLARCSWSRMELARRGGGGTNSHISFYPALLAGLHIGRRGELTSRCAGEKSVKWCCGGERLAKVTYRCDWSA